MTERLTIDELARRTGLTTRNIRAYQTRGLLFPPELRGRTGYYGPEHVARIGIIREMQAAGFNLEAIRRLLQLAPDEEREEALGFARALLAPWVTERAETVDLADLVRRFGADPVALLKAEDLGIIAPLGDGEYVVRNPSLLRAGEQVVALGVPLKEALAVVEDVKPHAEAVARAFVALFLRTFWEPFDAGGRPAEEWRRVREALEGLRPLALTVLVAAFRQMMEEEVHLALGEELERSAPTGRSATA
jgi:DNA-binding transcriptional MerR regulator